MCKLLIRDLRGGCLCYIKRNLRASHAFDTETGLLSLSIERFINRNIQECRCRRHDVLKPLAAPQLACITMAQVTSASCLPSTKEEIIYAVTVTTDAWFIIYVFSPIASPIESTLDGVEKRFTGGGAKTVGYRI